tara:strand:- start:262 stop:1191 length:930 start_codon:yes stop_codon:yes gene_type:complete
MSEINSYIEEIKNYSDRHTELKKSHHFVFNMPISINNIKPKPNQNDEIVLIMGMNPGETDQSWNYFPEKLESSIKDLFRKLRTSKEIKNKVAEMVNKNEKLTGYPVEASSNFKFWDDDDINNWKNKKKEAPDSSHDNWSGTIKAICETGCKKNNLSIIQTEYFFWSTPDIDEFENRFGYNWKKNPHEEFCLSINRKLIDYYNTKIIIYFGIGDAERIKKTFNLEEVETYEVPELKSNKKILAKLYFLKTMNKKDIPFLISTHPSNYMSKKEMECIRLLFDYICENDGVAMPKHLYDECKDAINSNYEGR